MGLRRPRSTLAAFLALAPNAKGKGPPTHAVGQRWASRGKTRQVGTGTGTGKTSCESGQFFRRYRVWVGAVCRWVVGFGRACGACSCGCPADACAYFLPCVAWSCALLRSRAVCPPLKYGRWVYRSAWVGGGLWSSSTAYQCVVALDRPLVVIILVVNCHGSGAAYQGIMVN